MNDFIAKLIALRNGAGNVVKGTLDNMSNVGERYDEMRQYERDRNEKLINKNFGNVENYKKFLEENPPAPTPPQQIAGFIKRLMQLRGGAEN